MRIMFEFPSGTEFSACSAVTGVVYIYDEAGTETTATPTGWWSIASGDASAYAGSADLARQYWFDFDVVADGTPSAVFTSGAFNTGVYSYLVHDDDDAPVVGQFDTKSEARDIRNMMLQQSMFAAATGSMVVNTNLNEVILYEDVPNSLGAIPASAARNRILARYKLYNAYGLATSENPVTKEAYQVAFDDYVAEFLSGAVGSGLK